MTDPPPTDNSLWTWLVPKPDTTPSQTDAAAARHNVIPAPHERHA